MCDIGRYQGKKIGLYILANLMANLMVNLLSCSEKGKELKKKKSVIFCPVLKFVG